MLEQVDRPGSAVQSQNVAVHGPVADAVEIMAAERKHPTRTDDPGNLSQDPLAIGVPNRIDAIVGEEHKIEAAVREGGKVAGISPEYRSIRMSCPAERDHDLA